jgi:hypothetical protein
LAHLDTRVPKADALSISNYSIDEDGDGQATGTGFWFKGELSARYFVRPCRKRFDLYQLSATPPSQRWHKENLMAQDPTTNPDGLPEPGRKKKSPKDLDKLLDKGIEESMDASDPPAAVQPEVHTEADRDEVDPDTKEDQPRKH